MKNPDAIFFDLFNTLVHLDYERLPKVLVDGRRIPSTAPAIQQALSREAAVQVPVPRLAEVMLKSRQAMEKIRQPGHREYPSERRFRWIAEQLGLSQPGTVEVMVQSHMQQMFDMMWCPPENLRLLDRLVVAPRFLASNFDHAATARKALVHFRLEPRLERIFISEELGWRKPGKQFFTEIIDRSGVDPSRSLFVGDDPVADVQGAARAGFQVVWIRSAFAPAAQEPQSADMPGVRVIHSLPELTEILDR